MDAATQRLGRSNFSVMMSNWLVAPDLIDRPKEKGATLKRNNEGKYMYKESQLYTLMYQKSKFSNS